MSLQKGKTLMQLKSERQHTFRPRYLLLDEQAFTCTFDTYPILGKNIKDISPHGAGLKLPLGLKPEIGQVVSFCLFYNGTRVFMSSGIVRWLGCVGDSDYRVSIGIEFSQDPQKILMDFQQKQILDQILKKTNEQFIGSENIKVKSVS